MLRVQMTSPDQVCVDQKKVAETGSTMSGNGADRVPVEPKVKTSTLSLHHLNPHPTSYTHRGALQHCNNRPGHVSVCSAGAAPVAGARSPPGLRAVEAVAVVCHCKGEALWFINALQRLLVYAQ